MFDFRSEGWRYSLCVKSVIPRSEKDEVRFYRIADVRFNTSGGSMTASLVTADVDAQSRDRPLFLYNRELMYRGSDIDGLHYLRWKQLGEGEWPETRCEFEDREIRSLPKPIEVIGLPKQYSVKEIPEVLSTGISLDHKPADSFLIAIGEEGDFTQAIMCYEADFIFKSGTLRMSPPSSGRTDGRTLPIYEVDSFDILDVYRNGITRKVCTEDDIVDTGRRALVVPVESIASEYVLWAEKQMGSGLSRTERQKLRAIVTEALNAPELIASYLGDDETGTDESITDAMREAVRIEAVGSDGGISKFVAVALESDASFRKACEDHVLTGVNGAIADQRSALAQLDKKVSETSSLLEARQRDLEKVKNELTEAELSAKEAQDDADNLKASRDEVIRSIEDDVALRIGLGAIARSIPRATQVEEPHNRTGIAGEASDDADASQPMADVYYPASLPVKETEADRLERAVASNLRSLGVCCLYTGGPDSSAIINKSEAGRVVTAYANAASLGRRGLVVDSSIAGEVADAISYALEGVPAVRVRPQAKHGTDYRQITRALENGCQSSVIVVEKAIGCADEDLLSSPLSRATGKLIIFPMVSVLDLKLLAPEVWGSLLYAHLPGLYVDTSAAPKEMLKATGPVLEVGRPERGAISDYAEDFPECSAYAPTQALASASIVELCFEKALADEDAAGETTEASRPEVAAAAQLLFCQPSCDGDGEWAREIAGWSQASSISSLARRLGYGV